MRNLFRGVAATLVCSSLLLASGCASFPAESLKDSKIPDTSAYHHKPSVYIEIKFFQGSPDDGKAVEIPSVKARVQGIVDQVAKNSGLFSSYTFDAFQQDKVDQTIKLYLYNHPDNLGGSMVMSFLCGFTFGLIPASATDNYTLVTTTGNNGTPLNSNDSINTWLGIWFLPAAGNTPEKATETTFTEMVNDAFKQLVESKQLKISALPDDLSVSG